MILKCPLGSLLSVHICLIFTSHIIILLNVIFFASQVPQIEGGTFQAKVAYADFPGRVYIQKIAEYSRLDDLLEALAEDYGEAATKGTLPRLDADPRIG